MRGPRNPFYIRFAEQIGLGTDFLRLFSPGILEILPEHDLWNRINVFRSAPGGGKTSLLKLFTPDILLNLYAYKNFPQYKDLYIRMKEIEAIDDSGPKVLSAMLSCTHNYSSLEDLYLDDARKQRLLLSLLNVRIILCMLRSALVLKRCNFPDPDDLKKLQLECTPDVPLPPGLPYKGSGLIYYDWACKIEADICNTIDSLTPTDVISSLPGHDSLFSLWLFRPQTFLFNGSPIAEKVIVMLDDVQRLTTRQRKRLLSLIVDLRAPVKIWIAERLEALSTDELLSLGNKEGRDWNLIYLESYWRDHRKHFESFAMNVADKRAESASEGQIVSFAGCLQEALVWKDWQEKISLAFSKVQERLNALVEANPKYKTWLAAKRSMEGSYIDKLFSWRTLEILITRDLLRKQRIFSFIEFSEEDLQSQEQSDVQIAAELFIAKEFNIPFYYGFSRLCSIASSNIEQFLALSGELFEEVASASLLSLARKMPQVNSITQDKIIRKAVQKLWDGIVRQVNNPSDVRIFIESISEFCRWETFKPNAPYSPGVTGIAIKMSDREKLRDPKVLKDHRVARLASTIATCLSYNIFEPLLDYKCKGQRWMILYLNRMLCVHFGLPLQYGGWREKTLKDLINWIEKGFQSPRTKGLLL